MANETILQITRVVTLPDSDASFEIQSVANGSAQCPCSALNFPVASGIFAITSATITSFTVALGVTLGSAATRVRLTLIMPNTSANMPVIGASNLTTTNFVLNLSGPTGNTTTKVFWEVLQ